MSSYQKARGKKKERKGGKEKGKELGREGWREGGKKVLIILLRYFVMSYTPLKKYNHPVLVIPALRRLRQEDNRVAGQPGLHIKTPISEK